MSKVRVCFVADVPEGEARRFAVGEREIAVVNLGGAGFRAVDAVCSHAHEYLDEGEVDVDLGTIECPKHGSTFELATGKPRGLPAILPVAVYPVELTDNDVLIEVSESE